MELNSITLIDVRNAILVLQVITAIVGSMYYKKYKFSFLKYFIFLLWYIVINDFIALYYSLTINIYNALFFNIYQIISFTFYLVLFKKNIQSLKLKKIVSYLILLYLISFVLCFFIDDFFKNHFSLSYIIGALFVISSIIMFFSEILNSDKIIKMNKMLLFWISIGLFVSLLPDIPFDLMRKYYANSPSIPFIFASSYLLVFANNILLITGFIWCNEEQRDYL